MGLAPVPLDLGWRNLFEIEGIPEDLAREAIRLAGYKLPLKTKFVKRD